MLEPAFQSLLWPSVLEIDTAVPGGDDPAPFPNTQGKTAADHHTPSCHPCIEGQGLC